MNPATKAVIDIPFKRQSSFRFVPISKSVKLGTSRLMFDFLQCLIVSFPEVIPNDLFRLFKYFSCLFLLYHKSPFWTCYPYLFYLHTCYWAWHGLDCRYAIHMPFIFPCLIALVRMFSFVGQYLNPLNKI